MNDNQQKMETRPETTPATMNGTEGSGPDSPYVETDGMLADPASGHAVPSELSDGSDLPDLSLGCIVIVGREQVRLVPEGAAEKELNETIATLDVVTMERDALALQVQELRAEKAKAQAKGVSLSMDAALLLFAGHGKHGKRLPVFARCSDTITEPDGTRWLYSHRASGAVLSSKPLHAANAQIESEIRSLAEERGRLTRKLAHNQTLISAKTEQIEGYKRLEDKRSRRLLAQAERQLATRQKEREQLLEACKPLDERIAELRAVLQDTPKPMEIHVAPDFSNVRVVVLAK